jgi:hypothetical protein
VHFYANSVNKSITNKVLHFCFQHRIKFEFYLHLHFLKAAQKVNFALNYSLFAMAKRAIYKFGTGLYFLHLMIEIVVEETLLSYSMHELRGLISRVCLFSYLYLTHIELEANLEELSYESCLAKAKLMV